MNYPRRTGTLNPCMTQRYSKLADDDLRLAVEAMERKRNGNQNGGKVISSGGRVEIMKMLPQWLAGEETVHAGRRAEE